MQEIRVGYGFDAHRLVEGRKLVIGGIEIDFPLGLKGHSDADVLSHAVIDALLGAARLGDIGENFPPSDPKYEDISSLSLLELVKIKLANTGYQISNIDATVICEKPVLGNLKELMAQNMASELEIDEWQISVKATTTEGLGFTGEGKGIAASAVALIIEVVAEDEEAESESGYEGEYEDE